MAKFRQPATIKQYADRLYYPGAGAYVTLDDLATMVEDEEDFIVYDARTGDDITPFVLCKIMHGQATHG